jgi:hypothetical protein
MFIVESCPSSFIIDMSEKVKPTFARLERLGSI